MRSAYLYLNFVCNNDCLFCASDKTNRTRGKREFTFEECLEFMDAALSKGLDTILINGGEPTVHTDIIKIVREAASRFNHVYMASNGLRFSDPKFSEEIVVAGLNGIGIPIYSVSAEKFDYLVQHPGAFRRVMVGVENLFDLKQDYDLDLMLKILVMRPNYQENPDIVSMIKDEFPEPDSITVAGLRVGKKAFHRIKELFVPYNIARPFTSETVRRILPYNLTLDFLPLCGLDVDLVIHLLENRYIEPIERQHLIQRPDGYRSDRSQPFHWEDCCLKCDVYDFCSKVHKKNAEHLNYPSQLQSISLD